ncbi:hypothetical protein JHK87_002657 [Glycine soja]|nr:hypothetical protein JHK87_002657 [Glycine soja]
MQMGLDPVTHRPRTDNLNLLSNLQQILAAAKIVSSLTNPSALSWLQSDATLQLLQNMYPRPTASNSDPLINPFRTLNSLPDSYSLLNDLLGFNLHSNLQNLYDGNSLSQIQPNFQNFEAPQQPTQHLNGGRNTSFRESQKQFGSTNNIADPSLSSSLPNLVSASPERSPFKEAENIMVNSKDCSTSFELTWGDFMDEETTETYWKGFIDRVSVLPIFYF